MSFNFYHRNDSSRKLPPRVRYWQFPFFKRFITFSIAYARNTKRIRVISSKVRKNFRTHVFLADIDEPVPLEILVHQLSDFASRHNLSNLYIVQTHSGGYHLYCLKTFGYQTYLKLLVDCPFIDIKYIAWTSRYYKSTLRADGDDLHLVAILERESTGSSGSLGHKQYLEQKIGITITENLTWEGREKPELFTTKIPK